jgi:hypothetical protein
VARGNGKGKRKGSEPSINGAKPKAAEPDEEIVAIGGDGGVLPAGYIHDYISGLPVRAGAEEVQAVQVFAKRLVEDFGYPKSHIITRPQYRVRRRPSEEKKSYPVDIAVGFS